MTPARAIEVLRAIDRLVDVPLVPMTYGAIVEAYGRERFCADAAAAGTEGLIVVDVPPEESDALRDAAGASAIDLIHLVAPTSRDDRLRAAAVQDTRDHGWRKRGRLKCGEAEDAEMHH